MRISITFHSLKPLKLPKHYNYLIQCFLYRNIHRSLSDKLHSEGYTYKKRRYRLFVFSRLLARIEIANKEITFLDKVKLFVASPLPLFIESLAENLLKKHTFKLNEQEVIIETIEICPRPAFSKISKIKMLSPLTIYSTLRKPDGKKKTYYYTPWESEFSELIKENLLRKYEAFYAKLPNEEDFSIKPLRVFNNQEKKINYKGTWIKGWLGVYQIQTTEELIEFAWDAGLGSKNSQGFGMFDIIT